MSPTLSLLRMTIAELTTAFKAMTNKFLASTNALPSLDFHPLMLISFEEGQVLALLRFDTINLRCSSGILITTYVSYSRLVFADQYEQKWRCGLPQRSSNRSNIKCIVENLTKSASSAHEQLLSGGLIPRQK